MNQAVLLILFPLLPALILVLSKKEAVVSFVTILSSVVIAVLSIAFAVNYMNSSGEYVSFSSHLPDTLVIIGDTLLVAVFLYICKQLPLRRYWIPFLAIIQYLIVISLEFTGKMPEVTSHLYLDGLASIMALVIGVVGTLITVYTVSYMKFYHKKHPEIPDRSRFFIASIFLFFFAMFGIIFSNSVVWIYFFWEITTLCSFIMISYSGEEIAIQNAFRALWMLLVGGVGFALAIAYMATKCGTIELQSLITMDRALVMLPVLLLCFAGMNKAAMYPFGNWLLGAMVAPTPSSALLHSSTMVKAGVYLVLRCSPMLKDTASGLIISLIGGLSFLAGSALSISQRNGKRILAYSTIANLGLIVLCAGVGTGFALWAAVLLVIFHAVAKALMFLCVGTVEHQIGSKDIEDMAGLASKMPMTTVAMLVGLSGMFLAPFGMLISKWAVIQALTERNPIFPAIVIFGGSMMLFFWTKWMGKLFVNMKKQPSCEVGLGTEWVGLCGLSVLTFVSCIFYPVIGNLWLMPMYGTNPMLYYGVEISIAVMLIIMLLPPLTFLVQWKNLVKTTPYLCGVNIEGNNEQFRGSFGEPTPWEFKNYYMGKFFSEEKLVMATIVSSIALFILMFFMETL